MTWASLTIGLVLMLKIAALVAHIKRASRTPEMQGDAHPLVAAVAVSILAALAAVMAAIIVSACMAPA